MPSEARSPRLAVLIDADNVSAKIADGLFEEIAKIGEASVRRIYGDFSNPRSKAWAETLSKHAITRVVGPGRRSGGSPSYGKPRIYPNSSLPIRRARMRPTSPWLSTQWTCFTAVGSMDFVWFRRTVTLPGSRPASVSRASTFLALGSRRRRRASVKPAADLSMPRTCFRDRARGTARISASNPLQLPSAAVPIINKIIAEIENDDGWAPLGEVGKRLANLASDFDPRNFGFRKLSDLVRKTDAFEVEHPKGGAIRIRSKSNIGAPPKAKAAKKGTK